jgi:hypothetical protein
MASRQELKDLFEKAIAVVTDEAVDALHAALSTVIGPTQSSVAEEHPSADTAGEANDTAASSAPATDVSNGQDLGGRAPEPTPEGDGEPEGVSPSSPATSETSEVSAAPSSEGGWDLGGVAPEPSDETAEPAQVPSSETPPDLTTSEPPDLTVI